MERFLYLFQFYFVCGIESLLELYFFCHFTKCKAKPLQWSLYIISFYGIFILELKLQSPLFSLIFNILILVGIGLTLKRSLTLSILTSILTIVILLLSYGVSNSIIFLFSLIVNQTNTHIYSILSILGGLLSLLLVFISFQIVLKKFTLEGSFPNQCLSIFLLPILLVLVVSRYISSQIYGDTIIVTDIGIIQPTGNHWQLLGIQIIALLSLFCILYGCKMLSINFKNLTRLALLEQETQTQKEYLKEANTRYKQTRAFRHDIKSHLLALDGLLKNRETKKARNYLSKLEDIASTLSYSCQTGNIVVDTLLNSKLSIAHQSGIQIDCTVKIPSPCSIDDIDLCIVFSNALENAVKACDSINESHRYIRISGKQKGDFFMLKVENSTSLIGKYQKGAGIGLSNIESIAKKYHGAVSIEKSTQYFQLNVLFIISRNLDDISVKPIDIF